METTKLVGKTIPCECGKTHRIDPREVLYADDAITRMPDLCAKYSAGRRVAVLFDARTRVAAGGAVADGLRADGWQVKEVLVPDLQGHAHTTKAKEEEEKKKNRGQDALGTQGRDALATRGQDARDTESPICDEATKDAVARDIGPADLIVGVGAGVISDLGKWIGFERDLPVVTFGTAASMNGYAAANVASAKDGVKIVVRARPPAAVASSPSVLLAAPKEMTASGLGDLLAKSVSSTDWRLNHLLFGDYYCARSVGLIEEIEPLYLNNPRGVKCGDRQALEAMFDALLLTGIAMTMAESSDPASGGEHLISHTLDMTAMARCGKHDLHGRQVGVTTVLASEIYRRVLAVERPEFRIPQAQVDGAFWGPITQAVGAQFSQKPTKWTAVSAKLSKGGAWDDLRRDLSAMVRAPETIRDCLREAGAAWRAEDIAATREHLLDCLLHANQMRARFTVLDLAYMLGILPDAGREIVEKWA
jgi:glycerol-1-phosphate dehydrogenase [NAD(P)+]